MPDDEQQRRDEEERQREGRQRQCEAAHRDREAASNQISTLSDHISSSNQRAAEAGERYDRVEEWLSMAAATQSEARSAVESSVRERDSAREELDGLERTLSQARADLKAAQEGVQVIGWEANVSGPDRVRDLEGAIERVGNSISALNQSIDYNKGVVGEQGERIAELQSDLSEASDTAIRARAEAEAGEEERSRRQSEYAEADGRVSQHCG